MSNINNAIIYYQTSPSDTKFQGKIPVTFNPATYTVSRTVSYGGNQNDNGTQLQQKNYPVLNYTGGNNDTLSLELMFNKYEFQHYSNQVKYTSDDLSIIKEVKEAVNIPVIGNGDILSAKDAKKMIDETGCDAVMIGRGTLGNPYLIKQIVRYLEDGVLLKDESPIERMKTCLKHFNYLLKIKPEKVATLEMRTHAAWYLKGLPNGVNVKKRLYELKTKEEFISTITEYMENLS